MDVSGVDGSGIWFGCGFHVLHVSHVGKKTIEKN